MCLQAGATRCTLFIHPQRSHRRPKENKWNMITTWKAVHSTMHIYSCFGIKWKQFGTIFHRYLVTCVLFLHHHLISQCLSLRFRPLDIKDDDWHDHPTDSTWILLPIISFLIYLYCSSSVMSHKLYLWHYLVIWVFFVFLRGPCSKQEGVWWHHNYTQGQSIRQRRLSVWSLQHTWNPPGQRKRHGYE